MIYQASAYESEHGSRTLSRSLFPRNSNLSSGLEDSRSSTPIDPSLNRAFSPIGSRTSVVGSQVPSPDIATSRPSVERRTSTRITSPRGIRSSGMPNNYSLQSHARLYRLLGDLYLMSGRYSDASIWYATHIRRVHLT